MTEENVISFVDALLRKVDQEISQAIFLKDAAELLRLRGYLAQLPLILKLSLPQHQEADRLRKIVVENIAQRMANP